MDIKDFLPLVRKPGRYIGGEVNSIKKDLSSVALKVAVGMPDVYEVGMSHLGLQVLYSILNARADVACERVFAPWSDMEALLRAKGMKLTTLESGVALNELDVLGLTLQYELSYTNILNMLELGGIPLKAAERGEKDPLVIGGGPGAYNPEPVADFFDAILIGDGEEAVLEMADAVIAARRAGEGRAGALRRLARVEGVYVPSFFEVDYNGDGTVKAIRPLVEGYGPVRKRFVTDVERAPAPLKPIVPFVETIHDRVTVEIARGCTRGCRFCEAGMTYRPARERSLEAITRNVEEALRNTGYDEVSLLALSAGDYTHIGPLLSSLMNRFVRDNVAVSLPSLRVGTLNESLATEIKKVRKTGFTLAPETGSERLRKLVNKGISEEDLIKGASEIFSLGWKALKLYFMIGLPTETDEDVLDIAKLSAAVRAAGRRAAKGFSPQVNVSVSIFVPKPHTPFQWEPQVTLDEGRRRQALLKRKLSDLKLGFKWGEPEMSFLEGVFSRGDRRLGAVVLRAFKKGCRMDGWGELFRFDLWRAAFDEEGLDMAFYANRRRGKDELFPWDHISAGLDKDFLWKDLEDSLTLKEIPDCKVDKCSACGVCDFSEIMNVVAGMPVEAAGAGAPNGVAHAATQGAAMPGSAPSGVERTGAPFATTAHPGKATVPPYKVKLRFSKTGVLRFISHLELISVVVRACRRAGLTLKYSQGFHPLPRISFSQPLPVGMESMDERVEMELEPTGRLPRPEEVANALNGVAPEGLKFYPPAQFHLKGSTPSDSINDIEYLIFLNNGPSGINIEPEKIDGFLRDFASSSSVLINVRKGDKVKTMDIKPLISRMHLTGDNALKLSVRVDGGANLRPVDILTGPLNLSQEDASLIPILKTSGGGSV